MKYLPARWRLGRTQKRGVSELSSDSFLVVSSLCFKFVALVGLKKPHLTTMGTSY
jgi:hypothetical protein